MKTRALLVFFNSLAIIAFLPLGLATGCKSKPSAFPLSMATLGEIHDGRISFEERDGGIFVSITDSSGDRHIHRLDYSGYSKTDALAVLKKKQDEVEHRSVIRPKKR